jgi:glycosyltransferase involved in cell wall biosynthesis
VYNGEHYLAFALDSILGQTFTDFELIISDNASTDRTEDICKAYAARDERIHYTRNDQNIGATRNYNRVFELAKAPLFKWAAHDDVLAPRFLEECVAVLERDPSVVLAHTKTKKIDEQGRVTGSYETRMVTDGPSPSSRFHDLILARHPCTAVFGVIRRDVLAHTPLIGSYVGSDRNLLAELGLWGRIVEIQEYLFYRRDHPEASISKYNEYERLEWFEPRLRGKINLVNWRNGLEYFRTVARTPLSWRERLTCLHYTTFWFKRERHNLAGDLRVATRQIRARISS